jgi:hypothetical protein
MPNARVATVLNSISSSSSDTDKFDGRLSRAEYTVVLKTWAKMAVKNGFMCEMVVAFLWYSSNSLLCFLLVPEGCLILKIPSSRAKQMLYSFYTATGFAVV